MNRRHDQPSGSLASASADIDLLSGVLRSVRLTGSMLFLVEAAAPFVSMAPAASGFRPIVLPGSQHLVSYHVVTEGRCWGGIDDAPLDALEAGDVLVIPHGHAYRLASSPDTPVPYGHAEAVEFLRQMAAGELPSVVVEGGGGAARTRFICGFLGIDLRPFNPVLAALPPMIVLRGAASASSERAGASDLCDGERAASAARGTVHAPLAHLIAFALAELRQRRSGSDGLLLRLSEVMFIEVVRRYLDSVPQTQHGWLAGLRDPLVARALACLHGAPAEAWTLESLADRIGSSRSVLAERFAQIVGSPPMHYLAQWRIQVATRLLDADANLKVASVAGQVGYASEAAFSRAFKRLVGSAPARWRQRST